MRWYPQPKWVIKVEHGFRNDKAAEYARWHHTLVVTTENGLWGYRPSAIHHETYRFMRIDNRPDISFKLPIDWMEVYPPIRKLLCKYGWMLLDPLSIRDNEVDMSHLGGIDD